MGCEFREVITDRDGNELSRRIIIAENVAGNFTGSIPFHHVAVMMLASLLSSTAAVEDNPAVHIEADIAKSCYSARIGFGSFWMLGGHSENFLPPTATPRCARGFPDGLTTQSAQIC
jgi:hypothetical protein